MLVVAFAGVMIAVKQNSNSKAYIDVSELVFVGFFMHVVLLVVTKRCYKGISIIFR